MQTQHDLVKVEGLRGAKYAVRKRVKGFLFRGEYFLCVDDGIPVGRHGGPSRGRRGDRMNQRRKPAGSL